MKIFRFAIYIFALIGFLGSIYAGAMAYQVYSFVQGDYGEFAYEYDSDTIVQDYFNKYIYFDYEVTNPMQDMPEPGSGAARLYGEVVYDQKPIEGLTLDVILNSKFKIEGLTTDSQGRFYLDVPAGDWTLNLIILNNWENKPEGDFIVLTGHEPTLEKTKYSSFANRVAPTTTVKDGDALAFVKLTLVRPIEIFSPDEGHEYEIADDGLISWNPVEGADTYLVKLSEVERLKNGSTSSEVLERRVQGNELAFSDIGTISSLEDESQVYAVDIMAFDASGKLVSNLHDISQRKFTAADFKFVTDEVKFELGQSFTEQSMQEFRANKKRIEATEVLINESMFDAAEQIISKISEHAPKGKKEALRGYLFAKKGLCERAENYFEKALSVGGKRCFPSRYRVNCQSQTELDPS